MTRHIRIVEVGPRDGLQNEPAPVAVADRIALIEALAAAGCTTIEAGSFVAPAWVPQMADTEAVLAGLHRRPGVTYCVLVPNLRGLDRALACNVTDIAVFAAASETFSQRNINCSIEESLARFAPVIHRARAANITVRGYVSCVLGCPYEGEIAAAAVGHVAAALHALGCAEISLGDTIGTGTPSRARALVEHVATAIPLNAIAVHFHDTHGRALANIAACLEMGVTVVDSAVAGLGGCPYAAGATGNVATEAVVAMLHARGMQTGIDLAALAAAGEAIRKIVKRPGSSAPRTLAGG